MAPIRPATIELYYDITSSESYLTLVTLLRYRPAWNLVLELFPVSQTKIKDATGAKDFPVMPIKAVYQERDLLRVSQRWGIDVRPPPGFPLGDIALRTTAFLRVLKELESSDVLIQSTLLLFEEYHSVHTPITSPSFFDCLIKTTSTTTTSRGTLSKERLQEILARSKTPESVQGVQKDVDEVVAKYGTFLTPWMVAHKVPVDDRSAEEQAKNPASSTQYQSFYGIDRIETMGYFLGPEYVWKGPWPDGKERFRPISSGWPGIPIEHAAAASAYLSKSRL